MESLTKYVRLIWLMLVLMTHTTHAQPSEENSKKAILIPLSVPNVSLSPLGVQDMPSLWVSRQTNCQLVRQQGRFLKNELAKSVRFLNNQTVEMDLDNRFKFHDGSKVNVEDVIATFNYLKAGRVTFRNVFDWIKSIESTKPTTLIFNLNRPAPNFLKALSAPNYAIFKKSFIESAALNKELWKNPVGCGEYRIQEYRDDRIVLTPTSSLSSLPIQFDFRVSTAAGESDLQKYDFVLAPFLDQLSKSNSFREEVSFDPKLIQMGINTRVKRWKKLENRCDLLSSVQADQLVQLYTNEKAEAASGLIPRGAVGFSEDNHNFDFEKRVTKKTREPICMAFLGVSIPENHYDSFKKILKFPFYVERTSTIQSTADFGKTFSSTDCDILVLGLKSNYLDGYEFLQIFAESALNYTDYHDAKIVQDIKESQTESDIAVKSEKYHQIEKSIAKLCLVKPLISVQMRKVLVKKDLNVPGIGDVPINEYFLGLVRR